MKDAIAMSILWILFRRNIFIVYLTNKNPSNRLTKKSIIFKT